MESPGENGGGGDGGGGGGMNRVNSEQLLKQRLYRQGAVAAPAKVINYKFKKM